eukprot:CAMPEP_0204346404 /NCGR_PEP_ID=MMETSP0469-20131031/27158_1 /ASSEMBLY_ACC=CAM_ASM_000384 /TAXON_ID=2969 /ORGANISM="Oxyrrhis marina" /LENGTH=31 /DNA_ID= /DNA_START= /DNA_END= /DNA_ORIENTATION=
MAGLGVLTLISTSCQEAATSGHAWRVPILVT